MCGKPFTDIESYLSQMKNSLFDKLFFLEKLPDIPTLYVDYGCADGSLIQSLYEIRPRNSYIGYDISQEMIDKAINSFKDDIKNVYFTTNWLNVKHQLKVSQYPQKVLILSSVVHEIYSYCTKAQIHLFYKNILDAGFNYIVVRDMMISRAEENLESSNSDAVKIYSKGNYFQIESFEKFHGSILQYKNLVHYLLKYRYKINWDREVQENYLPICVEDFIEQFKDKFSVSYVEPFRIKFLDECFKRDFDIELHINTHIKLIFKNVEN